VCVCVCVCCVWVCRCVVCVLCVGVWVCCVCVCMCMCGCVCVKREGDTIHNYACNLLCYFVAIAKLTVTGQHKPLVQRHIPFLYSDCGSGSSLSPRPQQRVSLSMALFKLRHMCT